jgi:hypothetical protein
VKNKRIEYYEMKNILEIWEQNPDLFKSKSLSQILNFIGNGKLRDNNNTSTEFRQLIEVIPTEVLKNFINDCLTEKFDNNNGGYALQDIINQIGQRLGFKIENGLYQGKQNSIGFDGIWISKDNYSYVIEVKTTDAYRINLDIIADYRYKLIESKNILQEKSSILIIVGRQDTGDLEAQIRGSKHAWDIRLLSSDSLIKLLTLKETLNDTKTIQQINEILKPNEYTKIDKLIELIFLTSQDIQLVNVEENYDDDDKDNKRQEYVSFNELCVKKIQEHFRTILIKESRAAFTDKNNELGIISIISKRYDKYNDETYWYGFHPHQRSFLRNYERAYIGLGCGSAELIFLIPYDVLEPLLKNMNITEKDDRMYWHIVISRIDDKYFIRQPTLKNNSKVDITKYRL